MFEFYSQRKREKPLKEEKLFIQIIKDQFRSQAIKFLSKIETNVDQKSVENYLNLLIQKIRDSGLMQEMLNEYLQSKIESEKKRYQKFKVKS